MAKTLLIVDDSIMMRTVIRQVAERNGFTVVAEAGDGEAAISLFEELKPQYVTMDITMPKIDGLTALDRMMKLNSEAKVLMITALTDPAKAISALEKGALASLRKPITQESLQLALEDLG
jgi:two-component system chemotaxis response regulator CheY